MKKSDIAMIVLIASLSIMVAFFVANSIPALKVSANGVKVKTIEPVEAGFEGGEPDPAVFNSNAINPTVQIVIGSGSAASQ